MIRIVLDTNVLVAGLLSDKGPPGQIVDLIVSGEIEVACDSRILTEYREVVGRPKLQIKQNDADDILQQIEHVALRVSPGPWANALPDPDDEPFLAVAEAADAFCVVTGNIRHFPIALRGAVRVLTPRQFVDSLGEQIE